MINVLAERKSEPLSDGRWRVTVTPPKWSGFGPSSLILTDNQYQHYQRWLEGHALIQDELPELSDDQREILISGIGPEEWDRAFEED